MNRVQLKQVSAVGTREKRMRVNEREENPRLEERCRLQPNKGPNNECPPERKSEPNVNRPRESPRREDRKRSSTSPRSDRKENEVCLKQIIELSG